MKAIYLFIPCPKLVWPGALGSLMCNGKAGEEGSRDPVWEQSLWVGASPLSAAPGDWLGKGVAENTKEESPIPCFKAF